MWYNIKYNIQDYLKRLYNLSCHKNYKTNYKKKYVNSFLCLISRKTENHDMYQLFIKVSIIYQSNKKIMIKKYVF